jgi:hypothetical protein
LILPASAKLAGLALSLRLWPLTFSSVASRPAFYCIQSTEKNRLLEANPVELYRLRHQGLEWLAQAI